jgi:hypothetical protein
VRITIHLLHQLGDLRPADPLKDAIATRRQDDTLAVAMWNLIDPGPGCVVQGLTIPIRPEFTGQGGEGTAAISWVDNQHGNSLMSYRKIPPLRKKMLFVILQFRAAEIQGRS